VGAVRRKIAQKGLAIMLSADFGTFFLREKMHVAFSSEGSRIFEGVDCA